MLIIFNCYEIYIDVNFNPTNFTLNGYSDLSDFNLNSKSLGSPPPYQPSERHCITLKNRSDR